MALVAGFSTFQLILGAVAVVVLGTVGLILGGIWKRLQSPDKEVFEHEDLRDLVKPEIQKLIKYWGTSVSLKLRYRYDEKGTVVQMLDYRAKINGDEGAADNSSDAEIDIDEDALEKDYKNDRISKRVYKMIKKFSEEDVYILLVRDSGFFEKLEWIFSEKLMSRSDITERLIIVPKRLVRDDVDYLTIKDQAEFSRFAGMDVAVEASTFNFIQSVGFKNLYSQALQDQQNYHKQVNFYSSRFTQELQKLEKKSDLSGGDWSEKKVKLVNED